MAEKTQSFNFKFENPTPDLVTMRAGRHGEWNEYVEFQPYNSTTIYLAQLNPEGYTYAYELHLGLKGNVKTLAVYSSPISAIEHAYKEALAVAQG